MLQRQLGGALGRQAGLNDYGIGPVFLHRGESGLEFLAAVDPDSIDRGSGRFAAKLDLFEERFEEGIGRVRQSRHAARRWQISRVSSTHLPANSAVTEAKPVTFPPGRGRLATSPVPIGSPVSAMTIGISCVACLAARAVGVNQVTITSTLRRTSSAANSGSRSRCPSADRNSNRMFCPST